MDHPELLFRVRAAPAAVFVELLRTAEQSLTARALKERLEQSGVDKETVDQAWRRAQPGVKRHSNVAFDAAHATYRWSDEPVPVTLPALAATEAFERLVAGRVPAALRAHLGDLVRTALRERDALEERLRGAYEGVEAARVGRERQARVDVARAVADVAMEVEELVAAGASAGVTVERIRAFAKGFDLTPIGQAGENVAFDPTAHSPIGALPSSGSPVVIVRPGYSWCDGDQDVLLARAQVALRWGDD